MFPKLAMLAAAAGLAFSLSACSAGPSESDLGHGAELLGLTADLTEDVDLDCVGAEFKDSGASGEALEFIASANSAEGEGHAFSESDQEALGGAMARAAENC